MVQFFFQVRQIVEIIIQRSAQKLDILELWGVGDFMEKYPGQWTPQHACTLPMNKSRNQKKLVKYFQVCWHLALQRGPKSLQCVGAWPRFIEPYSTLLSATGGKEGL